MKSLAVVLEKPEDLQLRTLNISAPTPADIVVDIEFSGISTGTERLLYTGQMPHFPGMGYPLVPGYESVGTVIEAGATSTRGVGERVFVPGSSCFEDARGLFGGAAQRLVVPGVRALPVASDIGEQAILLALAATAHHILAADPERADIPVFPDLIVGHGVLGRLLARLVIALGGSPPTVWEQRAERRDAAGYPVVSPADDERRDYRCVCDVSGDARMLETLIERLAPRGEVVLAGFYPDRLSFAFAPAFMREARFRVAAQWQPSDLVAVNRLVATGRLSLDEFITHRHPAEHASLAYNQTFNDTSCLKTILDWRGLQ